MKSRTKARILEGAAMLMIGDGLLALLQPRSHVSLWYGGPRPWRALIVLLAARPQLTRGLGAAEIGAGIWLARWQLTSPANGLSRAGGGGYKQ